MPLGFDAVVDHSLFATRRFRWRMATRPLAPEDWLQIDDAYQADLALKTELVRTRPDEVIGWLEGSAAAAEELEGLLAGALASYGHHVAGGEEHAIDRCGRSVQEDLCLMERRPPGWVLTAGSVCFPTRWDFPSKLGLPLLDIHGPVPGYAADLAVAVDRFFDRMDPGDLAWRLNWSLVDDAARRLDPGRRQAPAVMPPDPASGLHLRVERQSLRRLSRHRAIVFGIRVHVWPLGEVVGRLPASAFADHLASMPADVVRYKNLEKLRKPLLAWLARQ